MIITNRDGFHHLIDETFDNPQYIIKLDVESNNYYFIRFASYYENYFVLEVQFIEDDICKIINFQISDEKDVSDHLKFARDNGLVILE